MITDTDIRNAIDATERASLSGERLARKLAGERSVSCDATMRAAYDARIVAVHRATMAENEYLDALRTVAKRLPAHARTVATIAPATAPTAPAKPATIERKPIVDNGDDPSTAHGTPTTRVNAKGKRERMTKRGVWMLADKGTASKGQRQWLKDHGVKGAHFFSMAGASDRRFEMTKGA